MAELKNEIIIDAPLERIWEAVSNIEDLDKFDPTVKRAVAISSSKSGLGAKRKVDMKDGKNWFEEQCTIWEENKAITYQLTACSFPVHKLQYSYHLDKVGNKTKVIQIMTYQMKYGLFGKVMNSLVVGKQFDKGIKEMFEGLKLFTETNKNGVQ